MKFKDSEKKIKNQVFFDLNKIFIDSFNRKNKNKITDMHNY